VSDTLALLFADRAFPAEHASVAKLGVLAGSTVAALIGLAVLHRRAVASTPVDTR
jgi:Na+/H+ antiporter NhaA